MAASKAVGEAEADLQRAQAHVLRGVEIRLRGPTDLLGGECEEGYRSVRTGDHGTGTDLIAGLVLPAVQTRRPGQFANFCRPGGSPTPAHDAGEEGLKARGLADAPLAVRQGGLLRPGDLNSGGERGFLARTP